MRTGSDIHLPGSDVARFESKSFVVTLDISAVPSHDTGGKRGPYGVFGLVCRELRILKRILATSQGSGKVETPSASIS